jgi:GrpB-like predicted nucleotidyltransferase (UPF0157 family)
MKKWKAGYPALLELTGGMPTERPAHYLDRSRKGVGVRLRFTKSRRSPPPLGPSPPLQTADLIPAAQSAILFSMDSEAQFIMVDANRAREEAQRLFEVVSKLLTRVLPPTADVRHIGATAVPGCLTKGDLDIVVRVRIDQFSDIDAMLASRFARNEGSIRSETFSAFEDASTRPHLGIQLVAINGPFDFFHLFIEALQRSPRLFEEYNALKSQYNGANMTLYRKAKDAFIEAALSNFVSDP